MKSHWKLKYCWWYIFRCFICNDCLIYTKCLPSAKSLPTAECSIFTMEYYKRLHRREYVIFDVFLATVMNEINVSIWKLYIFVHEGAFGIISSRIITIIQGEILSNGFRYISIHLKLTRQQSSSDFGSNYSYDPGKETSVDLFGLNVLQPRMVRFQKRTLNSVAVELKIDSISKCLKHFYQFCIIMFASKTYLIISAKSDNSWKTIQYILSQY